MAFDDDVQIKCNTETYDNISTWQLQHRERKLLNIKEFATSIVNSTATPWSCITHEAKVINTQPTTKKMYNNLLIETQKRETLEKYCYLKINKKKCKWNNDSKLIENGYTANFLSNT